MKATGAKLLSFLQKPSQFVIPICQQIYSWTEKQFRQLWDDIVRAGPSDEIAVHFIRPRLDQHFVPPLAALSETKILSECSNRVVSPEKYEHTMTTGIVIGLAGLMLTVASASYVWWNHRHPATWADLRHEPRRVGVAQALVIVGAVLQAFALLQVAGQG